MQDNDQIDTTAVQSAASDNNSNAAQSVQPQQVPPAPQAANPASSDVLSSPQDQDGAM